MKERIQQYRAINKLKSTYRLNSVEERKESSAEHTWGCLMLAELFLPEHPTINKERVHKLLIYHDLVELEAGDTPLHPDHSKEQQQENEAQAALNLEKNLPEPLNKEFKEAFKEFEEQTTKEAQFAKAIDALEAIIHELDYPEDWKGWTTTFLKKHKEKQVKPFPILHKTFNELVEYCVEQGFLKKE